MKKTFKSLFIISLLMIIFTRCSDESSLDNEVFVENEKDSVFKSIISWGFTQDVVKDQGDHYLVDGDIVFYKNKKYASLTDPNTKQRQHPNLVTINDINVFINPEMDIDWRNASRDAINRWNAVDSKLNLNITTSIADAHILIMYDTHDPNITLPVNVFGRGTFPTSNGLPGLRIWVNPDFRFSFLCIDDITQNSRIANIQHELGHNLGLTHTNQSFGSLIPGTPNSDIQSVMNGGSACTINNFSQGDLTAIRLLYPAPWVGLPEARLNPSYTRICRNVLIESLEDFTIPPSPGADTYELISNSPYLEVQKIVYPNRPIFMTGSRAGYFPVTLKTTNQYGSSYATIQVEVSECYGGGGIEF